MEQYIFQIATSPHPPPPKKGKYFIEIGLIISPAPAVIGTREARKIIVDFNLVSWLRRKQKPEKKASWHSSFAYYLSTALHTTNMFFQLTVEINL